MGKLSFAFLSVSLFSATALAGKLPAGALLLVQSGGREWEAQARFAAASLAEKMQVEIVAGAADRKTIQRAVDRLEAKNVSRIIAVPVFASSYGEELNQARYLLGVRKNPSQVFLSAPHVHYSTAALERVKVRTPLVVTDALDADVGLLASADGHLSAFGPYLEDAALILVAAGPAADLENDRQLSVLQAVADAIGQKRKLRGSRAFMLRPNLNKTERGFSKLGVQAGAKLRLPQTERERTKSALEELRSLVRELSLKGRVIVLARSLDGEELGKMIRDALSGTFYFWGGTASLTDAELSAWLSARVEEGLKLKPMRKYEKPEFPPENK